MYTLFVCGAPHNSKGFEYAEIYGSKLPDNISQYIDIYDADKMKDGRSYIIQKLTIDTRDYTLLGEYIRINPSDQNTSRGSYIAVGILTDEVISLHVAMDYFCTISSLHASLKMLRNERNAFSTNFKISKNLKSLSNNYHHIPFLANIAKDLSGENTAKRVTFNDVLHEGKTQNIPDNSLENELNKLKAEVEKYIEAINDEKEDHRLTRVENDGEIFRLKNDVNMLQDSVYVLNQRITQKNEDVSRLEQNIERLRTENNSFRNQDIYQRENNGERRTLTNDPVPTNRNDRPSTLDGNNKNRKRRPPPSTNTITFGNEKRNNKKTKVLVLVLAAIVLSSLWYFDVGRTIGDMFYDKAKTIERKVKPMDITVIVDNTIDNPIEDINLSKNMIDEHTKKDTSKSLKSDITTSTLKNNSNDKTTQKRLSTKEKLKQLEISDKKKKTEKEATKSKSSKNGKD